MSTTSSYRRYVPNKDREESSVANGRRGLNAAGEAKTTGTSWTSLRFNRPNLPEDYRGHSSKLAKVFEPAKPTPVSKAPSYAPSVSSTSSRYSSATSTAAPSTLGTGRVRSALANYQKAVAASDRPTRPKPSVAGPLMTYRSQVARDMFSPTRYIPSAREVREARQAKEMETVKPSSLAESYLNQVNHSKPLPTFTSGGPKEPSRSMFSPPRTTTSENNRSIFSPPKDTYSSRISSTRPYSAISTGPSTTYQPPLSKVTSSSLVANTPRRPVSAYEPDLSITKALQNKPIPKSERPWRQRMADAAKLRDLHGDNMSNGIVNRIAQSRASRRNSASQNSGDELQQSLALLKSIVADPAEKPTVKYRTKSELSRESTIGKIPAVVTTQVPSSRQDRSSVSSFVSGPSTSPTNGGLKPYRTSGYGKTLAEAQMSESMIETPAGSARPIAMGNVAENVMSRSYSPIRSSGTLFGSPRNSIRCASSENVSSLPPISEPMYKDKGQTILEEIQERWGEPKKRNPRSSKERTLRRNSRQRSQSKEPPHSSSEEDESRPSSRRQSRDPPKKRRLRKRTPSIPKEEKDDPSPKAIPPPNTVTSIPVEVFVQPQQWRNSKMTKYKNRYVVVKRESRRDPPPSASPKRRKLKTPVDPSVHTVTVTVDLSSASNASASKTFKSKAFYSTSRTVTKDGSKKSLEPCTVQSCYAKTIKSVNNMMNSLTLPPPSPRVRLAKRRSKLPMDQESLDFALVFEPLFILPKTEEAKLSDKEEFFDCNQCLNHFNPVVLDRSSKVRRRSKDPSNPPSVVSNSVVQQPLIVDTKDEEKNKKTSGSNPPTGPSPGGKSGSIEKLHLKTEEEVFKSAQSSPQVSPMGNKQTQSQKPSSKPSPLQRVLAPFRKKPASPKQTVEPPPLQIEKKKSPPIAKEESVSDSISVTETNPTTATTTTFVDDDESKYNAVAEFKPNRKKKLFGLKTAKPVPGVWQGVLNEINISCNRRLTRKTITHLAVEALLKDSAKAKAIPRKFKQPIKKKKISLVEKTLEVVLVGNPNAQTKDGAFTTWEIKRPILIYKIQAKYPEPKPIKKSVPKPVPVSALAVLNQEISNRRRLRLGTEKTLKCRPETVSTVFDCKASKENSRNVVLDIKRKEEKRAANVTVIAVNVMDVNWAKASKNLKAIADKKKLAEIIENQVTIIEAEKARLSRTPVNVEDEFSTSSEVSKPVETQASLVLDDLRKKEPRIEIIGANNSHIPLNEDYYPGGPLILPDKSILEEYVKRKRGELERLHSEPVRSPSNSLREDSPCLSTVSELLPASSVKIVEPRQKSTAHLTAPQRTVAESVSLPGSNRNSKMIELLPYPPNFEATSQAIDNGNPVSGFRAVIRKPIPRKETLSIQSIQHFDTPKSPFEAAMQSQAAAMAKKASVTSTISVLSEGDAQDSSLLEGLENGHKRRPSVDSTHSMPPIASGNVAQSYTQAAASQPRHERYAAHIPVRQTSVETTGRQSTTSVDSANSGVLDTASRQLDQMIDQARYKHHQHRSKFKEAIDYLDQIFEDLKKEVDPPTAISSEKKSEAPVPAGKGIQATKAVFQKQVQQPQIQIPPQTTNVPIVRLRKPSDMARQQGSKQMNVPRNGPVAVAKPQSVAFHHPIKVASSQPSTSMTLPSTSSGPKPFPKIESTDVEVSETIVLPAKQNSEKMDFTRQWLSGDIKSWADKPDLVSGNLTSPNDSDDRSIGSCSAEVAAINAADRRKKRQIKEAQEIIKSSKTKNFNGQPTIVKPKATVPVKPQPIRPQPQYAPFPTNGQLLSAAIDPPGLQKAPSHEYISAIQRAHQERAGSQDYQSIGSVHSQEGYKPPSALSLHTNSLNRSGAFQQYPQRGSIHSLPDAAANGGQHRYPQAIQDPILAIDALVAELELNTEPDLANDKRRSFPTIVNESLPSFQQNPAYKAPPQRPSIQQSRHSLGLQKQDKLNGGSIDRGLRRLQKQQRSSLDEMANMLTSVAETINQPKAPPRKYNLQKTAFETINQEKITPSKVGAIQQMFETRNTVANGNDWRKKNREEETYYEIQEYSSQPKKNPNSRQNSFGSPSHHGSFPLPQPPSVPPPVIGSSVSSANSSQHGYYSSSTSSVGKNNLPQRHGSFKHSLSSRAASFDDDDDDGFYDNINVESHNRRLSEADNASLSSHQLPPTHSKGGTGRLGQLIRRIGGHGKPPMNASSSVSLNKMGLDPVHPPLVKSNSLSGEPWRQQAIDPDKSLRVVVLINQSKTDFEAARPTPLKMTKTAVKKPGSKFKRVFPPYAKFAIFFACGLEVFYHAFVMAINQKFFEMASKIFPVAFQMFNDTMRRGGVTFDDGTPYKWSDVELAKLNLYQTKLVLMWCISTCTILYSMLCVVPQFCEMEESTGENRTWCMKKPILGYLMAPILIFLVFVCAVILTWQWSTCQTDADLFHKLFTHALKEEKYLSVIERELNCLTDDDKEIFDADFFQEAAENSIIEPGLPVRSCNMLVESSMLTQSWLDPLYYCFILYHLLVAALFGYFNDEKLKLPCQKQEDEEDSARGADVESATRLI